MLSPVGRSRRWHAVGDPQTSFENFIGILRSHELLDDSTRLRPDVGLLSIGDHFDFDGRGRSVEEVGRDGWEILRWLASHPADQVVILLGNHDAARVMELAYETNGTFAAARELAARPGLSLQEFTAAFPRIPTPDIALRDYSSFSTEQRELVQELLLTERMQLACVGRRNGRDMLVTHAGVSTAQVEQLGIPGTADSLAIGLAQHLHAAVNKVRTAWNAGQPAALDLAPLHTAGRDGQEGGGLLYHRASGRSDDSAPPPPLAPRRFHPRELPRGLVQLCGHTGHHKARKELRDWVTPSAAARERGGLRTLRVGPSGIAYEGTIVPAREGEATMYFIDIEMNVRDLEAYPLFDLDEVRAVGPRDAASGARR